MFILSGTTDKNSFFSTIYFLRCINVHSVSEIEFVSETYSTAVRCHTSNISTVTADVLSVLLLSQS